MPVKFPELTSTVLQFWIKLSFKKLIKVSAFHQLESDSNRIDLQVTKYCEDMKEN